METTELTSLLTRLLSEPNETEWLEFKESYYEPEILGEYLSALANSANLHGKTHGYLVFGVRDITHEVVGTKFNPKQRKKGNQPLLIWLSTGLAGGNFETYEFSYNKLFIVLFQIKAASGQPVKFYGKAFIRVGECKTSLSNYSEKERRIWTSSVDWSAQICERAKIDDLDRDAIRKSREEYAKKNPSQHNDILTWDDITFLNKAKITIQGSITNTAILLLGKPESSTLLSPAVARITWILKDDHSQEKDYAHFDPPFILNVDKILARINNLTIRTLPSGTLFPIEILQYDPWVIRESLHNCIAHQDYSMQGRVLLTEFSDKLSLVNRGCFIPGSVENVIRQDTPPSVYRNSFLAHAMVNLNMIDTQGGGIKKMFTIQAKRYFPLPDYDLSDTEIVSVTISGTILDEKYTRLLMERSDLDIFTIILLDKVQKRVHINREEYKQLKKHYLVEGRYPNIYIAARVASVIGYEAKHIRNKGLDKQYYIILILELINTHQPVDREKIDELLMDKLPEVLSIKQKKTKIHNLLYEMSGPLGLIKNFGTRKQSKWRLSK
jgi:ATP-dependent DNA helicase RecG